MVKEYSSSKITTRGSPSLTFVLLVLLLVYFGDGLVGPVSWYQHHFTEIPR